MLEHWLTLGGVEIFNSARLQSYLDTVGQVGLTVQPCGCPTLTPALLGDPEYVAPDADPAPWYDPAVPESADFLGLLVLSVNGLEDRVVTRQVTPALPGGAALGRPRAEPRTVTVTGVLLANTCCGADYGLAWLGEALQGCGQPRCDGEDLRYGVCCPPEGVDQEEFVRRYERTIRRVALVQGPTVLSRTGDGCGGAGGCDGGTVDLMTVEFVLTAGLPWPWTTPEVLLETPLPRDASEECITWCVHDSTSPEPPPGPVCVELPEDCEAGEGVEFSCDGDCPEGSVAWPDDELCPGEEPPPPGECDGGCRLAACPDPAAACQDPGCRTPTPPAAPPPETCFCSALAVETACFELDLAGRPGWFAAAPVMTVEAGSEVLRRVTIAIYERRPEHEGLSCDQVAEVERCNPHSVYEIGYVPAGGVLQLDGQTGRAVVTCGVVTETSPDVFGRDGGPPSWRLLDCGGRSYCVCISTDVLLPPAGDATLTVALSGRGY